MKRKINLQLVGIAVLAVLATLVCLTYIYFNTFERKIKDNLQVSADLLQETGYFNSVDQDVSQIDLHLVNEDLRVTWIAQDGTVLYDNDAEAASLENHADRPEIIEAFESGSGESVRRSTTFDLNTVYYAELLDNGTVLRVATTEKSIQSYFFGALPIVIVIIVIIIIICASLSHYMTKQIIAPIERMAEHMEDTTAEPAYKELVPFSNMIRKQHEDILAAAKMRQDFTANVSHELKTPLTAITGYAELMENHMVDAEQADHFAAEIQINAKRLLALINDSIELSELDHGKAIADYTELDLDQIVKDGLDGFKAAASNRHIEILYEGTPTKIRGDYNMICELLDNLTQNAIRYNNDGGYVFLTVGSDTKTLRPYLSVRDNGIGIPEEDQEHVFERFYRVDKSRSKATGGTGLGLAIVKHIAELHSAEIVLKSKLGQGTEIKIIF